MRSLVVLLHQVICISDELQGTFKNTISESKEKH